MIPRILVLVSLLLVPFTANAAPDDPAEPFAHSPATGASAVAVTLVAPSAMTQCSVRIDATGSWPYYAIANLESRDPEGVGGSYMLYGRPGPFEAAVHADGEKHGTQWGGGDPTPRRHGASFGLNDAGEYRLLVGATAAPGGAVTLDQVHVTCSEGVTATLEGEGSWTRVDVRDFEAERAASVAGLFPSGAHTASTGSRATVVVDDEWRVAYSISVYGGSRLHVAFDDGSHTATETIGQGTESYAAYFPSRGTGAASFTASYEGVGTSTWGALSAWQFPEGTLRW